jgi:hypothetical protein
MSHLLFFTDMAARDIFTDMAARNIFTDVAARDIFTDMAAPRVSFPFVSNLIEIKSFIYFPLLIFRGLPYQ